MYVIDVLPVVILGVRKRGFWKRGFWCPGVQNKKQKSAMKVLSNLVTFRGLRRSVSIGGRWRGSGGPRFRPICGSRRCPRPSGVAALEVKLLSGACHQEGPGGHRCYTICLFICRRMWAPRRSCGAQMRLQMKRQYDHRRCSPGPSWWQAPDSTLTSRAATSEGLGQRRDPQIGRMCRPPPPLKRPPIEGLRRRPTK